jgi:hypothetical protein
MDDDIFSAKVLSKLPLADAAWRILHFTLADSWLADLWNRERGRCYEKVLEFSTLARLITEALTQHGGSGRQAFERGQESDTLPVAISSAFDKLGNLPLPLSQKLLEEGTQRLGEILPQKSAVEPFLLPACWDGHEVFGADGKAIKHVKRLLKPLRGLQAGILGARASVVLNLRTGMAVGMIGDLDGEAGEGPLTAGLLSNMAAAAGAKRWSWIGFTAILASQAWFWPPVVTSSFAIAPTPISSPIQLDRRRRAAMRRASESCRSGDVWASLRELVPCRCAGSPCILPAAR